MERKGTPMTDKLPRCIAYDCAEPRQTTTSEFCVGHQGLLWDFHLWTDGWDDKGAIPRSFDVERAKWAGTYNTGPRAGLT